MLRARLQACYLLGGEDKSQGAYLTHLYWALWYTLVGTELARTMHDILHLDTGNEMYAMWYFDGNWRLYYRCRLLLVTCEVEAEACTSEHEGHYSMLG